MRPAIACIPDHDERFMRLALALGARHLGLTWPNPSVGAVVVRTAAGCRSSSRRRARSRAAGRTRSGWRSRQAGERARGATLYVTLEPCSHIGRSPPCADAILDAGIAGVVSALEDPDPRVLGHGHTRLRDAGIASHGRLSCERGAPAPSRPSSCGCDGRPEVTVKLAADRRKDLPGRGDGERLMITGETANARVHLMRAHADAIMVGIGTVLADDPMLDVPSARA